MMEISMKKGFIVLGILLIISSFACFALPTETKDSVLNYTDAKFTFADESNALGFYYESFTGENGGGGLQYQKWFNKIGIQATFGGYYQPENYSSLDYSVYFDFQYSVFEETFSNGFGGLLYMWLQLGHHGFSITENQYDDITNVLISSNTDYIFNMMAGVGIGIDFVSFKHISIPIQCGYSIEFPSDISAGMTLGIGVRYRY